MDFKLTIVCAVTLLTILGCGDSNQSFVVTGTSVEAELAPLPLPSSVGEREYQRLLYPFLNSREYLKLGWHRDKGIRDTGPYQNGVYFGTHPAVRIYYSPEVIQWLESDRTGTLPDGTMIVKEMFPPPAIRYAGREEEVVPTQWTTMVRDSQGSEDGWYWSYFSSNPADSDPPVPQQPDDDKFPFNYPDSGFGLYCVRCHGSAANNLTFASLSNIEGFPGEPLVYPVDNSWMTEAPQTPIPHPNDLNDAALSRSLTQALNTGVINQEFLDYFDQFPAQQKSQIAHLPPVTRDKVVAQAHREFVSSDQCMSCHSGDTSPFGPNMVKEGVDLSPWGEWSWSMMGLAGRDPIFYSQLETEEALHVKPGGDFSQADIQNFCLQCHGVMGQRQFNAENNGEKFTVDYMLGTQPDSHKDYLGGLGRDGVSCMVCHQIQDQKDFPFRQIDTGKFVIDDRVNGLLEVFGQYDHPVTSPMVESLAILPKKGEHIQDSLLCASCHSVNLPVLDEAGQIIDFKYEQATYFEWQNSASGQSGADFQSCQDCHMPQTFHSSEPLEFKIANIQDQDFPPAEGLAPKEQITVEPRADFSRHELSGINVFALEFFRHFPDILGVRGKSFMTGYENGLENSINNSLETAARSARLDILSSSLNGQVLESTVKVTNLAGHRFPSGVGFRRLFIEFLVRDNSGQIVWASGRSNELGIIVDSNGVPLPSESHAPTQLGEQAYQPHHQIVDSQDKVQIYEELLKDSEGKFTTSFLARVQEIKENRLLPRGWTAEGPPGMDDDFVETTLPAGEAALDPDFLDGSGSDTLRYRATLPPTAAGPFKIEVKLFYQAIPPIYLNDRFDQAQGPATRRLHYMASRLNTDQTSFPGWKLAIAEADSTVKP